MKGDTAVCRDVLRDNPITFLCFWRINTISACIRSSKGFVVMLPLVTIDQNNTSKTDSGPPSPIYLSIQYKPQRSRPLEVKSALPLPAVSSLVMVNGSRS